MPLITLITDFGTKDFFVGSLKGNIYSEFKDPLLVDVTHNIERNGYTQAAYVLKTTFKNFPKGSIHLMLVDTEAAKSKPVLFEYQSHYFLGMDNGIFNILLDDESPDWIVELSPEALGLENFNNKCAFFAAVLGAINKGADPEELGERKKKLEIKKAYKPIYGDWGITGEVIYIDIYENLIVNIERPLFEQLCHDRPFSIDIMNFEKIEKLSKTYSDVPLGEVVAFFNDADHLEIAVNQGKASSLLGIKLDKPVKIEFK